MRNTALGRPSRLTRPPPAPFWLPLALIAAVVSCDDGGPSEPTPSGPVLAVTAGYYHLCALGSDGNTYCWGFGGGTTGGESWYVAARVVGGHNFTSLTSGEFYTCGLDADGGAYCWGTNSQSVLGNAEGTSSSSPLPVAGAHRFQQLAGGEDFACGLGVTGEAYCWGWNVWGQVGSGDTVEVHPTPTAVVGGIAFSSLAAGYAHACGVDVGGDAYCWGRDFHGVLGQGVDAGISPMPLPVVGGLKFSTLSAGLAFTCGITVRGDAYCWGTNAYGELGNPSVATQTREPVRVAGGHRWAQLDAGPYHTCGVTTDNEAYCWGAEWEIFESSIGRPTAEPYPVPGGHEFRSMSAGYLATCGVSTDGELFCWGQRYGDEPFKLSIETAG